MLPLTFCACLVAGQGQFTAVPGDQGLRFEETQLVYRTGAWRAFSGLESGATLTPVPQAPEAPNMTEGLGEEHIRATLPSPVTRRSPSFAATAECSGHRLLSARKLLNW